MNRYFLEVSYKGTDYAGFQVQENALTIQEEVEKALAVLLRKKVSLTGSSRTDSGVHALQNYFHFDMDGTLEARCLYNVNALLPPDIAAVSLREMHKDAHCRFDAVARQYRYMVYGRKDPFMRDRAYYFPYTLDLSVMREAADIVKEHTDFTSFSKRNTQVKTFNCNIFESGWEECEGYIMYRVRANRFLRGMVRGLVGTMLQVGRKKISAEEFRHIIKNGDSSSVDFSVPGSGLCLEKVEFSEGYFERE
jgi:tRNA pseudouridine38-40 synthase